MTVCISLLSTDTGYTVYGNILKRLSKVHKLICDSFLLLISSNLDPLSLHLCSTLYQTPTEVNCDLKLYRHKCLDGGLVPANTFIGQAQ